MHQNIEKGLKNNFLNMIVYAFRHKIFYVDIARERSLGNMHSQQP